MIRTEAIQVAIGINWDGRRSVLAVELANRESRNSWPDFLSRLRNRGLRGVEFVVTDDHAGLKQAIAELLPEAIWQRCYVHFLRNALDYLPRRADERLYAGTPLALRPARSIRSPAGPGRVAEEVATELSPAL